MIPNGNPIFCRIGATTAISAYNSAVVTSDGVGNTGSNMTRAFNSDANNGSFVQKIRLHPHATAANTTTTATVIRVYYSTIGANNATTSAADTSLIAEVLAPAVSASNATSQTNYIELPLGFAMGANTAILVTFHHTFAASTGWQVTTFGGHY